MDRPPQTKYLYIQICTVKVDKYNKIHVYVYVYVFVRYVCMYVFIIYFNSVLIFNMIIK